MIKTMIAVLAAVVLTGCASGTQPRALQWGVGQPLCFAFCFAQSTVTDAEGSSINATGAVSNANTQSTSATQSPTLKFGGGPAGGTGDVAVPAATAVAN